MAALVGTFARFLRTRGMDAAEIVYGALEQAYPERAREEPAELRELARREARYEQEFQRKAIERLRRDLPRALAVADPEGRRAAVEAVLAREKRYVQQREEAMITRSLAAADLRYLRQLSPEGAYWRLSPFVVEHTLDCLAMGEKFWPWSVLDKTHPPMHHGCPCSLTGLGEAVGLGLMTPDQVPDPKDAELRARILLDQAKAAMEEGVTVEEVGEHLTWLQEDAYERRWGKGTSKGGEFRPKRGGAPGRPTLRRLLPDLPRPLAARRGDHRWRWVRGRYTKVPVNRVWNKRIDGIHFSSPPGSANIYRDGKLVLTDTGSPDGEKRHRDMRRPTRRPDPPRLHADQEAEREVRAAADNGRGGALKTARWALSTLNPDLPPVGAGDGPEALEALRGAGFRLVDVEATPDAETRMRLVHPDGPSVEATWDGHMFDAIAWHPNRRPPAAAGPLDRPPQDFREFAADGKLWAQQLGKRWGAEVALGSITVGDEGDHAGTHTWGNDITLGSEVAPSIDMAAATLARGEELDEFEKRYVYASYHVQAHEVLHAVNPIDAWDYGDTANANLEEALVEELAHALAAEKLREHGYLDVLAWADANPDNLSVRGNYGPQRTALRKLLEQGNLDSWDQRELVEHLKFEANPAKRLDVIADLWQMANPGKSPQEAYDQVELTLANLEADDGKRIIAPDYKASPGVGVSAASLWKRARAEEKEADDALFRAREFGEGDVAAAEEQLGQARAQVATAEKAVNRLWKGEVRGVVRREMAAGKLSPGTTGLLDAARPYNGPRLLYRTPNAHAAYKGKAVWGVGAYYAMDRDSAAELQLDPHSDFAEEPDYAAVNEVKLPDDQRDRFLEIDADDLPKEGTEVLSGDALRRSVLDAGYDGIRLKVGANLGGDQLVAYRGPLAAGKQWGVARTKLSPGTTDGDAEVTVQAEGWEPVTGRIVERPRPNFVTVEQSDGTRKTVRIDSEDDIRPASTPAPESADPKVGDIIDFRRGSFDRRGKVTAVRPKTIEVEYETQRGDKRTYRIPRAGSADAKRTPGTTEQGHLADLTGFRYYGTETTFSAAAEVPTAEDAQMIAAQFPKSARVKATTLDKRPGGRTERVGLVTFGVKFTSTAVTGEENEAGAKRVRAFVQRARALGYDLSHDPGPILNAVADPLAGMVDEPSPPRRSPGTTGQDNGKQVVIHTPYTEEQKRKRFDEFDDAAGTQPPEGWWLEVNGERAFEGIRSLEDAKSEAAYINPGVEGVAWKKDDRGVYFPQAKRSPGTTGEVDTAPPIPDYSDVDLELGKSAGGSTGARWAFDSEDRRWLSKAYNGDANRVANEALANAVYRRVGAAVAPAGIRRVPTSPDFSTIPDQDIEEEKKLPKGRVSTGVILLEPDGRVWIYEPKNHYGGYEHTFPKGGLERGLTPQQNAHKELWEETGLHGEIFDVLGDYKGDTGVTRYYVGRRTGGEPTTGPETEAVKLVTQAEAAEMLNRQRDKAVLADVGGIVLPEDAPGEDTFPPPRDLLTLAYPTADGETRKITKPSRELAEYFMTDALLANWDFIGLTDDNVLWDDQGQPIRLDQGGTFEYRARGEPKDYGPVPTEVWTMLGGAGQGLGKVQLSDEQKRDQARHLAASLPDAVVDDLVDAAPFEDDEKRERIRENLKARVGWMRRYAAGEETVPEIATGPEAAAVLRDGQREFETYPEEDNALDYFYGPEGPSVNAHLRSKKAKHHASIEVQGAVEQLDGLLGAAETDEDVVVYGTLLNANPEALDGLVGETVRDSGFLDATVSPDGGDGPTLALMLPAGSHAVLPAGLEANEEWPEDRVIVRRGVRMKILGKRVVDGKTYLDAVVV